MILDFDFAEFLTEFNHGELNQQLGARLREVVAAVQEHKKVGELTVKFTIKHGGSTAIVVPEIKSKTPNTAPEGAAFYVREDGALVRNDPRQVTIEFKSMGVRDNTPGKA